MTWQHFDPPELHTLSDDDYNSVVEIHRRAAALLRAAQVHKDNKGIWVAGCRIARVEGDYFFTVGCGLPNGIYVDVYNTYLSVLDIDRIKSLVLPRLREHMILDDLSRI